MKQLVRIIRIYEPLKKPHHQQCCCDREVFICTYTYCLRCPRWPQLEIGAMARTAVIVSREGGKAAEILKGWLATSLRLCGAQAAVAAAAVHRCLIFGPGWLAYGRARSCSSGIRQPRCGNSTLACSTPRQQASMPRLANSRLLGR